MSNIAGLLPFDCPLPPEQRGVIEELWRDGFVRIRGLLGPQDAALLGSECRRVMEDLPRTSYNERSEHGLQYRTPILFSRDWAVLTNLPGLSPRVDDILERLFTHAELAPLLRAILGTGYKMWSVNVRRSERTDTGLRLHQDAIGEFGMAVLLEDVPDRGGGSTAFLPGSHRFPVKSRDAGMVYINPKYLARWIKQTTGKAGDVYLFCKSIWHGRLPAAEAVPHDAILLGFFASGYAFTPFDVPRDVIERLPPELARLHDMTYGATRLADGRYLVQGGEPQPPRLIDALYRIPRTLPHPTQLLRILPPIFRAIYPIRKMLRRQLGV